MPGAAGAYAASTGTIYLNASWLENTNSSAVLAVLTEELGHWLDNSLNPSDTPSDEGELFAALLLGTTLSPQERDRIQSDNDQLTSPSPTAWLHSQKPPRSMAQLATTS